MNPMPSTPGPVTVPMPDGEPYIIKSLLSAANHKQEKGVGYRSVGLTLTQRATGHAGETCARSPPLAVPAPVSPISTGWLGRRSSAWRWRCTLLLAQHPELFRAILKADLARELAKAASEPMVARLNVVSDVAWETGMPGTLRLFPDGAIHGLHQGYFPRPRLRSVPPTIT